MKEFANLLDTMDQAEELLEQAERLRGRSSPVKPKDDLPSDPGFDPDWYIDRERGGLTVIIKS